MSARAKGLRRPFTPLSVTLAVSGILALLLTAPSFFGGVSLPFASLVRFIFYVTAVIFVWRWLARRFRRLTWSLRNRLVAAYIFVAVVPVLLIAIMVGLALWLFYGQYAADLFGESIRDRIAAVEAVSVATVQTLERSGRLIQPGEEPPLLGSMDTGSREQVLTYSYQDGRSLMKGGPELPKWLKPGFSGLVLQSSGPSLAAYSAGKSANQSLGVLALLPVTPQLMDELAHSVGAVQSSRRPGAIRRSTGKPARAGTDSELPIIEPVLPSGTVRLSPKSSLIDWSFNFPAFVPITDWQTGEHNITIVSINSRPSVLNDELFNARELRASIARWPLWLLGAVAIAFLIIEVISLITGIRLTRTMTRAVNDLYEGTRRINAGDFSHNVAVTSRDQLAVLAESFNSMTDSIRRLLEEQRQRQRLDNELAIAHEVQTQLFPRIIPSVRGIEVTGMCIPARVVSGDYYDFIALGEDRLAFALGDISGKGISAALLMATLASAIRAYQRVELMPASMAAGSEHFAVPAESDPLPPSLVIARINEQLYTSTTQEKYATLFYGIYDGARRQLRYTNAGHLPPAVLGRKGRRRLTAGGMVVGLFDTATYSEGVVNLEPGDLVIAWSDGITEPENDYGEEFGEERLFSIVEAHADRPLDVITQAVLSRVREWNSSQEQPDDVSLVLARVQ